MNKEKTKVIVILIFISILTNILFSLCTYRVEGISQTYRYWYFGNRYFKIPQNKRTNWKFKTRTSKLEF